jgi:hypothetical protein
VRTMGGFRVRCRMAERCRTGSGDSMWFARMRVRSAPCAGVLQSLVEN